MLHLFPPVSACGLALGYAAHRVPLAHGSANRAIRATGFCTLCLRIPQFQRREAEQKRGAFVEVPCFLSVTALIRYASLAACSCIDRIHAIEIEQMFVQGARRAWANRGPHTYSSSSTELRWDISCWVVNLRRLRMNTITRLCSLLVLFLTAVSCSTAANNTGGASALGVTLTSSPPASATVVATKALPATPNLAQEAPFPTMPSVHLATTTPPRLIELDSPSQGAKISNPVRVRGFVSVSPFESTLRYRVYDAGGQVVGEGPIMVASEMGQPGNFDGQCWFTADASGPGRVEVAEISPKDGSVIASTVVDVMVETGIGVSAIEIPGAGAQVMLPLRILARVGQPRQQVIAALRWQDGTELVQTFVTLQGEDGRGLLIDSLNWLSEGLPPQPPTQPAILDLRNAAGEVLASQEVVVLSPDDPGTQEIRLPLVLGETVQEVQRRIPRTAEIGRATLEELLWGPFPPNLAGFGTALPTPQEVLAYAGRTADWGPRVTLRQLTIVDGLATADFSKEMQAYGGGSLRVMLIRQQIEQALMQFPTVHKVIIAIEGDTEAVLQP